MSNKVRRALARKESETKGKEAENKKGNYRHDTSTIVEGSTCAKVRVPTKRSLNARFHFTPMALPSVDVEHAGFGPEHPGATGSVAQQHESYGGGVRAQAIERPRQALVPPEKQQNRFE